MLGQTKIFPTGLPPRQLGRLTHDHGGGVPHGQHAADRPGRCAGWPLPLTGQVL